MADTNDINLETTNNQVTRSNNLQNLVKCISCLPCFPSYTPPPDTPNLDELRKLYSKFKNEDPEKIEVNSIQRSSSEDLCEWTNKILVYLPNVHDAPESDDGKKYIITHFDTIKKFYSIVKNAGFDSAELDTLFNSVQIYEAVTAIAFVILNAYPHTLKRINDHLNDAVEQIQGHTEVGCFTLTFCGAAILSNFNRILGLIDEKIGELGIPKLAEKFLGLIEVFCRFINLDLKDQARLVALSESVQDMIKGITQVLRSLIGDSVPGTERKHKWGPLSVTERIRAKLAKFETQSTIVGRTINSFENFFNAVRRLDDDFEDLKTKSAINQRSLAAVDTQDPAEIGKIEARRAFANEVLLSHEANFQQIKETARIFQHIDTIMTYGVLLFKNEDDVLNPLLDHVDECTQILNKFASLHPLYKILLGKNYLSKLKLVLKKILDLIKSSNLIMNSPKEFLKELKQKYPNLIYLLCESYINDKIKHKIEFLPDGLEDAINASMDKALAKFKEKFKW